MDHFRPRRSVQGLARNCRLVGQVGTADKGLEAEGKLDQAKGSGKAALEYLKERVKDAVADHENAAAEKVRDTAENVERSTEER